MKSYLLSLLKSILYLTLFCYVVGFIGYAFTLSIMPTWLIICYPIPFILIFAGMIDTATKEKAKKYLGHSKKNDKPIDTSKFKMCCNQAMELRTKPYEPIGGRAVQIIYQCQKCKKELPADNVFNQTPPI